MATDRSDLSPEAQARIAEAEIAEFHRDPPGFSECKERNYHDTIAATRLAGERQEAIERRGDRG